MTTPHAIIVGASIIGATVFAARLVAPYELTSGPTTIWRLNTITGDIRLCDPWTRAISPECSSRN